MESVTGNVSREDIVEIVKEVRRGLRQDLADVGLAPSKNPELSARWDGGELVLRPSKEGLQEKTIPIESFFRKLVLARERLRVLEQKINNHPKLADGDRIELQEYITRIYGSFTTFNVLFAERSDWFVGDRS